MDVGLKLSGISWDNKDKDDMERIIKEDIYEYLSNQPQKDIERQINKLVEVIQKLNIISNQALSLINEMSNQRKLLKETQEAVAQQAEKGGIATAAQDAIIEQAKGFIMNETNQSSLIAIYSNIYKLQVQLNALLGQRIQTVIVDDKGEFYKIDEKNLVDFLEFNTFYAKVGFIKSKGAYKEKLVKRTPYRTKKTKGVIKTTRAEIFKRLDASTKQKAQEIYKDKGKERKKILGFPYQNPEANGDWFFAITNRGSVNEAYAFFMFSERGADEQKFPFSLGNMVQNIFNFVQVLQTEVDSMGALLQQDIAEQNSDIQYQIKSLNSSAMGIKEIIKFCQYWQENIDKNNSIEKVSEIIAHKYTEDKKASNIIYNELKTSIDEIKKAGFDIS